MEVLLNDFDVAQQLGPDLLHLFLQLAFEESFDKLVDLFLHLPGQLVVVVFVVAGVAGDVPLLALDFNVGGDGLDAGDGLGSGAGSAAGASAEVGAAAGLQGLGLANLWYGFGR